MADVRSDAPWFAGVCPDLRCRGVVLQEQSVDRRARLEATRRRQVPGPGTVGYVPANQRRTVPQRASRVAAFAAHLEAMMAEAASSAPLDHSPVRSLAGTLSPSLDATVAGGTSQDRQVLAAACGTCRGFCCHTGGTRAWITHETMQRVMADPGVGSPAELRERYLAQLPARSYRDACVYQAAGGCALEPALRSDTCHRYVCEGASALIELARAQPTGSLRVAATDTHRVLRVRHVRRS